MRALLRVSQNIALDFVCSLKLTACIDSERAT